MSRDMCALDPFSTVLRLALLRHLPENTKVGIIDNALRFYQPTLMGSLWRTYDNFTHTHGVSHHALYQLRTPIERALDWYYADKTAPVFKMASGGLLRLAGNYVRPEQGNVLETLRLFSTLLANAATHSQRVSLEFNTGTDRPRLVRLRESWTPAEIAAVCSWISLLESDEENRHDIIECIDRFLTAKDRTTRTIINAATV